MLTYLRILNCKVIFWIWIFWITGKDIYIFNGQHLVSKKILTDLGLPATIERIRLVYTWNYWTEQPMYIWTKDEFWRVDKVWYGIIRYEYRSKE